MDRPDTREWLSTNGLGGYASATACGANTRRYHGLLVAALEPPGQRTVLLSRLDETVIAGGEVYELGASFWSSGAVAPEGFRHLTSFRASPVPTWEYQVGLGRLVKRVACVPGKNAVAISYRLEGGPPVRLDVKVLANSRDFHGDTHGHPDWQFRQEQDDLTPAGAMNCAPTRTDLVGAQFIAPQVIAPQFIAPAGGAGRLRISVWDGAPEWSLAWDAAGEVEYRPAGQWYWGYSYPEEAARGLSAVEDAYCLGFLGVRLAAGDRLDLLASAEPVEEWVTADELAELADRRRRTLVMRAELPATPEAASLVAAADPFLVRRASTDGTTVIAGYHWFGDWGRDTMISLPGLTLTTRRFEEAREILRTFGRYVDRGMLPNRFPDGGEQPEYNTVDATLWWFHALDRYQRASGDDALVREQFPLLADVVDWHIRGTRHGIRVDPYDVLGFDRVGDASLRPNQLFAFSLPTCAFSREQGEAVLEVARERLLTPFGPRSLAPGSPEYDGHYAGDAYHRDSVYHQGAVWPWLLVAYADALLNVRGRTDDTLAELRERIRPLLKHVEQDGCLGSVAEIFDGDAPHAPNGCVAQAWSVAELLRIYALTVAPANPAPETRAELAVV